MNKSLENEINDISELPVQPYPEEHNIIKIVDSVYNEFLEHENKERRRNMYIDKPPFFSISSAGTCLLKQLFNELNFEKEPIDEEGNRKMRVGTLVHDDLEKAFNQTAIWDETVIPRTEQYVRHPSFPVHGTFDLALVDHKKEYFVMIDYKTISDWGFRQLRKDRKPKHRMQVSTYAKAFAHSIPEIYGSKHPVGNDRTKEKTYTYDTFILYINKNNSKFRLYKVEKNWEQIADEYWQTLLTFTAKLEDKKSQVFSDDYCLCNDTDCTKGNHSMIDWQNEHLPDEKYGGIPYEEWECKYCPYTRQCVKSPYL